MNPPRLKTPTLAGLALALALAACSDSSGPGGGSDGLTAAQAADIGAAASDEVEVSISGITLDETVAPLGAIPVPASATGFGSPPPPVACATLDDPTDTDGDGIPDDGTYTFALPACHFEGVRGGTLDVTGAIGVIDPSPNAFDYSATLIDFTKVYTNPEATRSFTAIRNGTRSRTGTANGASLTVNMSIVRQVSGRPEAHIQRNGTVTFTPEGGATLAVNQPLPSGFFTLAGSLSWDRGEESFSFTISTPVPLHYNADDPECLALPRSERIDSGELRASGVINGKNGYLRVRWTACGVDPEFVWVVTP